MEIALNEPPPLPVSARKARIQAAFSRAALTYDAYGDIQHTVAQGLLARLPPSQPQHILEIGCGTGNYTAALAQRFPDAQITAVDFCPEMLAVAQKKLTALVGRIAWELADGEEYAPTDELKFDLITSSSAVQWFDDPAAACRRFQTLLTPSGQLAFAVFGPDTFHELRSALHQLPHIQPPAASFVDQTAWQQLLSTQFPHVQVDAELLVRRQSCLLDLLKIIQKTGVSGGHWRGWLTPSMLQQLEQTYLQQHGDISYTYQIFYCLAGTFLHEMMAMENHPPTTSG